MLYLGPRALSPLKAIAEAPENLKKAKQLPKMNANRNSMKGSHLEIVFDRRFQGPFPMAHGGYLSGTMAMHLESDTVEVTMRSPTPIDKPLILNTETPDCAYLYDGDKLLNEARPVELNLDLPDPITIQDAKKASLRHVTEMPYPDCFGCGSARSENDGLHLRAGHVEGRDLVAIDWVPLPASVGAEEGQEVPEPIFWATMECPVIRAMEYSRLLKSGELVLLGTMTAKILDRPKVGLPYFIMAWSVGREGRKITLAGTMHDESGDIRVMSRLVFITIKKE